jgi:hypothetical protein
MPTDHHGEMTDQEKYIPISTTDALPPAFGGDRAVTRMSLTWATGHRSFADAEQWIMDSARANDYDAVIGVRFVPVTYVSADSISGGLGTRETSTECQWTVYGTAIGW